MCRRTLLIAVAASGLLVCARPAEAHKLNVFAWVEGRQIVGEAYFRGHAPLAGAAVTFASPAGETLGKTTTDAGGKFLFTPKVRADHQIVVDAGDGHSQAFTVKADELPADLPAGPSAPSRPARPTPPPASEPARASGAGLESQIGQLRAELQEFKSEVRFRDVLGGIGYILGLMGVAFYVLGARKPAARATDATPKPQP